MVRGIVAPDGSTLYLLAFRIFFFAVFFLSIIFLIDREKQSLIQTSILNETVARSQAESEKNRREIQERFMTMLMHELKTPLAIIQLAATSLGRHLLPNSGDATRVTNINRSVDDLNALIERCAQADQIEQGVDLIHEQLFAVTTLTDDLLQTVDASRIRLVGTQAQTVFSDYQYVRLILRNLLSNALKYSPADSMIELQIESTSVNNVACVSFRVVNTVGAAGMPDPAQVFSRYYRSEAARQHVGAGLGLWLAQAVARQLGSEVHFQAPHGQVVFGFCLAQA
jgi:signal transduction histidine kinase